METSGTSSTSGGPVVRGEVLHLELADGPAAVLVGGAAWFAWLAQADRFVVEAPAGRVTVRRERAGNGRGAAYWRAYRKAGGRLRRAYLGDDSALTAARLAAAAAELLAPQAPGAVPNGSEQDEVIRTRLEPPQHTGPLVPRPALLAELRAMLAAPATLVVAAPGFGKTTLLAQLLGSPGAPAWAWLTLEPADGEPARLVRALAAALGRAHPGAEALAAGPPEAGLAALLNALAGRADPLALVLDDYQLLGEGPAHGLVAQLIERAPAQLRVVVASREDPPLPLARLRASGRLRELRAPELAFRGAEAARLLRLVSGRALGEAEVAALEERTEGWAAGLQLAGLALRGQPDARRFAQDFAGTHRFVMDYLVEEVLRQQTPALRAFLLETSVLDSLTAPLCDAVRGASGSQALLEEAERRGLFLTALDGERRHFRYHALFAEVLRAELRREAGPARMDELRRRAARWQAARRAAESPIAEPLTAREREVLALVAEGAGNAEIAERLTVAVSTVKAHVNSIFGKLGADSRTQAVARARALGLVA